MGRLSSAYLSVPMSNCRWREKVAIRRVKITTRESRLLIIEIIGVVDGVMLVGSKEKRRRKKRRGIQEKL